MDVGQRKCEYMGIVTKLEKVKGVKDCKNVYVDNECQGQLSDFCIFKYKIVEGGEVDMGQWCDIQSESDVDCAVNRMLGILSKFRKTENQVRQYLVSKGYSIDVTERVLDRLKKYGYINDELFAKSYIEVHKCKMGKCKLGCKLRQFGVVDNVIEDALKVLGDEREVIESLVSKYMNNKKWDKENVNKLVRYLAGKGYDVEEICGVVNSKNREVNYEDW